VAASQVKNWIWLVVAAVVALGGIWYAVRAQRAPVPTQAEAGKEEKPVVFVPGQKHVVGGWGGEDVGLGVALRSQGEVVVSSPDTEELKPDVVIEIKARRAEFDPQEIRVKKGQVVQLKITGEDNGLLDMPELAGALGLKDFGGHGFNITGPYGVWITGIKKDVTKTVTFKATEAGEFEMHCVVLCSPDHYLMWGKFIVEE